jgi:hypothetical protein
MSLEQANGGVGSHRVVFRQLQSLRMGYVEFGSEGHGPASHREQEGTFVFELKSLGDL